MIMNGSVMRYLPFSNILSLHQEYFPTAKSLHQKVPQVIFCNSYDDCTKINPMSKNQPYSMINKELKQEFLGPEKNKIELEISKWYQCNETTQLDYILKRFDRIKNTVSKLCVPLHGRVHWSVLAVGVLPQTRFSNDYTKETNYINQHNKSFSVLNAANKVAFSPCGGQNILDCTPKRKIVFHIPTFISGQMI